MPKESLLERSDNNIVWHLHKVTKADRLVQKKQTARILWFTGLSGSGKSTIAGVVEQKLFRMGYHTYLLDGDNIRHGINKDLGFSDRDRVENIRRVGEIARVFVDAGLIVLTAFISPFRADRQLVRDIVEVDEFIEVHMAVPLAVCEQRDPKELYKKARRGEIKNFTGIDSDYEQPEAAEITIDTTNMDVESCADKIILYLKADHIIHD